MERIDDRTRRGNRGASRCFRSRNQPGHRAAGAAPDRPHPVTRARVTLSDVAARAGVSRTTASFVLTGRRDMRISADTEQKVLQAARELNYRPNLLARNLANNHSHTIGLLSDRITTDAYGGQLIRGALSTALLHNQLMVIGETGGDPQLEKQLVHGMLDRGVGAFLYACAYTRRATIPIELRGHRLVLVNCISRDAGIQMVVPDETQAGQTAAAVLLGHGHRDRIVGVGETPPDVIAAAERLAGIRHVLSGNGLDLAETIPTRWWPEPAYHAVRAYLAAGHRPTAFICLNDRIAMGAYQAARDHGVLIPEQLSVVSFDDSDLASWLRPALTSVAIPHLELGRRSVELLLDPDPTGGIQRIPMPLKERDSIAPPAD